MSRSPSVSRSGLSIFPLAVGAEHRQLKLRGENELVGCGVSYCAVCDGGFYAGADVAVAGGGDTVSALNHAGVADDFT